MHYTVNPVLPRSQAQQALRSFTYWCHRSSLLNGSAALTLLGRELPVSLNPFPPLHGLYIPSLPHFISHCHAEQVLLSAHGNPGRITDTKGSYSALLFGQLDATTSPDLTEEGLAGQSHPQ